MIATVLALLLQSGSAPPALPVAQVRALPVCTAAMLSASTDGEGGAFDGMSRGGVLVVIRNVGGVACRIVPMAQARLLDRGGQALGPFATHVPGERFLHPGPVVLPIAIAAGAEMTAPMRWVSGPVYDQSVCLDPATLVLQFGEVEIRTPMGGHLCGDAGKGGVFADLPRFALDPVVSEEGAGRVRR